MNKKIRRFTILFITLLVGTSAVSVFAQRTQFRWGYTNGTYTGIFDAKKYSKQQVENTYALMDYRHIYMFEDNSIYQPPHVSETALSTLDKAYKKDVTDLEA